MKFGLGLCLLTASFAACASPPASSAATAAPSASPAALKSVKLVIVGDSTVCNWPLNDRLHREGWGMRMQDYFEDDVQVINLARSGRSTKTFIQEGLWADALSRHPDFVLIQFGHNDSHAPANPESTNAATDYREYLRKYIADTRAAGGEIVLITPMCRRTPTDNLRPYAEAMIAVGAEKQVPVIDLHAASAKLYAQLGPDGVHALEANLANGQYDPTHFNEKGAREMARLVMAELPAAAPQLQPYLK